MTRTTKMLNSSHALHDKCVTYVCPGSDLLVKNKQCTLTFSFFSNGWSKAKREIVALC